VGGPPTQEQPKAPELPLSLPQGATPPATPDPGKGKGGETPKEAPKPEPGKKGGGF
jgi:hypothetical protein